MWVTVKESEGSLEMRKDGGGQSSPGPQAGRLGVLGRQGQDWNEDGGWCCTADSLVAQAGCLGGAQHIIAGEDLGPGPAGHHM